MASGLEMMLKMAGLDPVAIVKQVTDIQTLIKSVDDRLNKLEQGQAQILSILTQAQKAVENGKESS